MVDWLVAGILFLILIWLIYCSRLLVLIIEMKKVIFEWENRKEEGNEVGRKNTAKLTYENVEWEYKFRLAVIEGREKSAFKEYKAEEKEQDIQYIKEAKAYRKEQRRKKRESVRKFLSRITSVSSRKKD